MTNTTAHPWTNHQPRGYVSDPGRVPGWDDSCSGCSEAFLKRTRCVLPECRVITQPAPYEGPEYAAWEAALSRLEYDLDLPARDLIEHARVFVAAQESR